jgi:hypothetical protein
MSANSEIILSSRSHPGESSVETVTGEKYKGDGFYSRADGLHTVQYTVIGFIGSISIQATLATNPENNDWFIVSGTTHTSTAVDSDESDGAFIRNFTGNYVWVRAVVKDWTDGSINSILLNH